MAHVGYRARHFARFGTQARLFFHSNWQSFSAASGSSWLALLWKLGCCGCFTPFLFHSNWQSFSAAIGSSWLWLLWKLG